MADKIYLRMIGYSATIAIHAANIVDMDKRIREESKDPEIREFATLQLKFFTCWTFIFQIGYSVFGLVCDLLTLRTGKSEQTKQLSSIRETLFSAVLWPSTFFVFAMFWPIYLYDETLIFPPFSGRLLSPTNNNIIHTFIVFVVLWETTFLPRNNATSHIWNVIYIINYKFIYLCVLLYTYATKGVWPYPILKMTYGTPYFPLFVTVAFMVILFGYYTQWPINTFIWGTEKGARRRKFKKNN